MSTKMKLGLLILALIVSSIGSTVFGQTTSCQTIYETVDTPPTYNEGTTALMGYFERQLSPIIRKYHKKDDELSAKVMLTFTIDANGKVIDVVLSNHTLPEKCTEEMRAKVLTMTGWTPGMLNKEKVCSQIALVISCIKWGWWHFLSVSARNGRCEYGYIASTLRSKRVKIRCWHKRDVCASHVG